LEVLRKTAPIVTLVLLAGKADAQLSLNEISRILVPQNERYQFTATARGAEGIRVNPASVASSRGINLHYNTYVEKGKFLEHDFILQNFLFNVAYRRASDRAGDYHLNHYTATLGGGVPELTFGASFNCLRSDLPSGSNGSVIHLGASLNPAEWISIAAVRRNINQPTLGGVRLTGQNVLGLGFDFFNDRLTVATDATLPNRGRLQKDVAFKFGLNALLVEGLRLYAAYEKTAHIGPKNFFIGVNLYIPNFDFFYDAHFDEDQNYKSGVLGASFSTERRKSVFKP